MSTNSNSTQSVVACDDNFNKY